MCTYTSTFAELIYYQLYTYNIISYFHKGSSNSTPDFTAIVFDVGLLIRTQLIHKDLYKF